MDQGELQALRAIIVSDRRPWPVVTTWRSRYIVDVRFGPSERAEADALADAVRELGFEATVGEKLALSEGLAAEAAKILVLVVTHPLEVAGAIVVVNNAAKGIAELSDRAKKLYEKLRPFAKRKADETPALKLPILHAWLDSTYGKNKWRYDREALEIKPIAEVTLFHFIEEVSGETVLVRIGNDDTVVKLPAEWLATK